MKLSYTTNPKMSKIPNEKISRGVWHQLSDQPFHRRLSMVFLKKQNPMSYGRNWRRRCFNLSLQRVSCFLKRIFFRLDMEENDDLRDHINMFIGLITQSAQLDETFKDEDKEILVLASVLPIKFNIVTTSLLVGKTTLALDETVVCLLEAEKLMK